MRRVLVVSAIIVCGLTFGAGGAYAASWVRSTDGSVVTFADDGNGSQSGDYEKFHVCDTKADGHAVYAEYAFNSGALSKHNWSGGNDTCKDFWHDWAEDRSVKFRSCEEINNWPNQCSSYATGPRS